MSIRSLITIAAILTLPFLARARDKSIEIITVADTVYSLSDVDTQPQLEGGMQSLYDRWHDLVQYPPQAKKLKIEGRVFLSFIIDENGNMVDPKVLRGIRAGCDEAAIDALMKAGLKWTPATKGGQNVKVSMVLPFVFKLK